MYLGHGNLANSCGGGRAASRRLRAEAFGKSCGEDAEKGVAVDEHGIRLRGAHEVEVVGHGEGLAVQRTPGVVLDVREMREFLPQELVRQGAVLDMVERRAVEPGVEGELGFQRPVRPPPGEMHERT